MLMQEDFRMASTKGKRKWIIARNNRNNNLAGCEYACRPRYLASTDERGRTRHCRTLFEFRKLLDDEEWGKVRSRQVTVSSYSQPLTAA
jgi:hypothetical protein